jgi:hypothetical protein
VLELRTGTVQAESTAVAGHSLLIKTPFHSTSVGGATAGISHMPHATDPGLAIFSASCMEGVAITRLDRSLGAFAKLPAGARVRDLVSTAQVRAGALSIQAAHRVLFETAEAKTAADVRGRAGSGVSSYIGGNRRLLQIPGMRPPLAVVGDYFDMFETEDGRIALRQTGSEPLRVQGLNVMITTQTPNDAMWLSTGPNGELRVEADHGNRNALVVERVKSMKVEDAGFAEVGVDGAPIYWPAIGGDGRVAGEGNDSGDGPSGMQIPAGSAGVIGTVGSMGPADGSQVLGGLDPDAPTLNGRPQSGSVKDADDGFTNPDAEWGQVGDVQDPSKLSPTAP